MNDWLGEVASTIERLKRPSSPPIVMRDGLGIRPVTWPPSPGDVGLLVVWRNEHPRAFFTWFEATEASTRRWIDEVHGPDPHDLMVMLTADGEEPWGHLGLSVFDATDRSCELGRVMRGGSHGQPGGMRRAIDALLAWASLTLSLERAHLKVFEDNSRAIACYEGCGFEATDRWPIRSSTVGDVTRWIRDDDMANPETFALRMSRTLQG